MSDDPRTHFSSFLARIEPDSIVTLALRVRSNHFQKNQEILKCTVMEPPKCGSFNFVYTLSFTDDVRWILRIPFPGEDDSYTPLSSRLLLSEIETMSFIRENTFIPMPEIYDFNDSVNNPLGVPYILMEAINGFPVSKVWFDDSGPTPLRTRRLRILETVATAMAQLNQFSFDKIGSLQFNSGKVSSIGECKITDDIAMSPEVSFLQIGPFSSTREYFEALLEIQGMPRQPFKIGIHRLLKMMIHCISSSSETSKSETFVLAHPDFDSQNVLVSEDGTLMALLDWDNFHTVPRCIGCSRYPGWITRDWDPAKYGYCLGEGCSEDSPEELTYYRKYYAEKMTTLISDVDYTTKSHLFEAIWIAATSQISINSIVRQIFLYIFPQTENDSLDFYNIVTDLAEGILEEEVKVKITAAFRNLLKIEDWNEPGGDKEQCGVLE